MEKKYSGKLYTAGLVIVVVGLMATQFNWFGKDVNANSQIENQNLGSDEINEISSLNTLGLSEVDSTNNGTISSKIEDGVQVFRFDLQANSLPTLNVKAGVPVRLVINADQNNLNSCNYAIVSNDLGIQKEFNYGENIIEFTVDSEGQYLYSCWMGMIGANINVSNSQEIPEAFYGPNVAGASCCSR